MFVDVDEQVDVLALFKHNKVVPAIIKWNGRNYKIKSVDMVHQVFEGSTLIHYFSVSDQANSFRLAFNTKTLKWILEQVYHQG